MANEVEWKEGLEPGAMTWEHSQAISLKRIADAVVGTKDRLGLTDSIATAIEQGIIAAAMRK